MKKSKIKINPVTMEIEIEVSDSFLEKYFERLTKRFPNSGKVKPTIKSIKTKTKTTTGVKKKKGSIQEGILERIKKSTAAGVSIGEIAESLGLKRTQIYYVIHKLKSKGIIKTAGRGNYRFNK